MSQIVFFFNFLDLYQFDRDFPLRFLCRIPIFLVHFHLILAFAIVPLDITAYFYRKIQAGFSKLLSFGLRNKMLSFCLFPGAFLSFFSHLIVTLRLTPPSYFRSDKQKKNELFFCLSLAYS